MKCLTVFIALTLSPLLSLAAPGDNELVSVGIDGNAASESDIYGMSSDGRYVMFLSWSEVVSVPSNGTPQYYVRDRSTGETVRVTQSTTGQQPNLENTWAGILSPNGRQAAFGSNATNLVAGVTSGTNQAYLRDIPAGTLELVSRSTTGQPANDLSMPISISGDGRYVVFASDGSNLVPEAASRGSRIYVRDRVNNQTRLVSSTIGPCGGGSISANGRYVTFSCYPALLPADTNTYQDVYLRDLTTGALELISTSSAGLQANEQSYAGDVSADGRYVVFTSFASNLVPNDTNGLNDIFLRDRSTGTVERVSISTTGAQGNGNSWGVHVSPDGRYVAFRSDASNFVTGDVGWPDVFVRDRQLGTTTIASIDSSGQLGGAVDVSDRFFMSDDGRFVGVATSADWAPNDTNGTRDVYVHEMGGPTPPAPPPDQVSFTLKPASLDFGAVAVGTTLTKNFWLRNKATSPLAITRISMRGTNAAEFKLRTTCGSTLAPGAGCALKVTFAPVSAGTKYAKVRVDAGGKIRINPVSGEATP